MAAWAVLCKLQCSIFVIVQVSTQHSLAWCEVDEGPSISRLAFLWEDSPPCDGIPALIQGSLVAFPNIT